MTSLIEIARNGFEIYFRDVNLEDCLRDSTKETSYDSHSNGFYLKNNDIRIAYIHRHLSGENLVELWFLKTNPKFCFSSDYTNMKKIPRSLSCGSITIHTGSTYCFSFPLEKREVGDTICIENLGSIDPYPTNPPKIKQEWFEEGALLLKNAVEKYNLKKFYIKFEREVLKIDNRSFLEKLGLTFS